MEKKLSKERTLVKRKPPRFSIFLPINLQTLTFRLMKTFPFKGQPANKIVSMFPVTIPNKKVSLQKLRFPAKTWRKNLQTHLFTVGWADLSTWSDCCISFLMKIHLIQLFLVGSTFFPSWTIHFAFVYYLQYKLHSNIRKKLLFLHWETNMIPKQIPSSSKLWQNKNHLHFSRQSLCGHHCESAASWIWIMKWLRINKLLVNFWGRGESYLTPSVIVD